MNENQESSAIEISALVDLWPSLSITEKQERFQKLVRTDAEELFLSLPTHDQADLIREGTSLEKRGWVRLLAPDDIADLIQDLGLEHKEELLNLLDPQTKRDVTALLAYAEDIAGGLMSSRFVRLRPDMSVDEAISYLRIQSKSQAETIYYCYVIQTDQTLVGVISFRELFSSPPHKKISEIMQQDLVKVPVSLDQEQIGRVFLQHELMAIPVVDEWNHMKGIVTFDDVANVVQEEATEDFQKLGGAEALDAPYFKTSFLELLRKRAGWLVLLFFGQMLTTSTMGYFQDDIQRAVVLSLFIPLIISSGGNSGSQASTLIIRSLALGEVRLSDWWRVFSRELFTGFCLGLILAILGALRIIFWPTSEDVYGQHYVLIGLTVGVSILGVVMWGAISGSMLPFVLKKLNLDPATASAPFVATLVDVTGLIIYLSAAAVILKGTVL